MPDSTTTQILVERVQSGDRAALDDLCSRYLARVLTAVRVRLGANLRQKVESWDIVQEAMLDAVRNIDSFEFRTEGAFLKYLNKVVENRIRDAASHWNAQKRNPAREVPDSNANRDLPTDSKWETPSQIAALREDYARLELALDKLPETERELVLAVKLEGRSYKEIADDLEKSPDALRMQVNRAMKQLAIVFEQLDN